MQSGKLRNRLLQILFVSLTTLYLPDLYSVSLASTLAQAKKSVVKLYSTKRFPDYSSPWNFQKVDTSKYYGVRISKDLILTTAQAVDHGATLEMELFERYGRQLVKAVHVDFECNLALISLENDENTLKNNVVASVGPVLKPNDKVWIFSERSKQVVGSQQLIIGEYHLARSETSWLYMPHYSFPTSQKGFGFSEPVFNEQGQLTALVVDNDGDHIQAVPSNIIKRFLEGFKDPSASGFLSLGVVVDTLITTTERLAIGAPKSGNGIRIAKVFDSSALTDILRPNDVLLRINHMGIDAAGFVDDPVWQKVPLQFYLLQLDPRKPVTIEFLRNGESSKETVKLSRFNSDRFLVPFQFRNTEQDLFYQYLGFVFVELSRNFFSQWGRDWTNYAPLDLMKKMLYDNTPQLKLTERVVVLSRVTPDKSNHGYQKLRNIRLLSVNGIKVVSLQHLESLLQNTSVKRSGQQFTTFQFANEAGEVVLFYDEKLKISQDIAKKFNIWRPSED